jgi:hypothetical protein
MKAALEAWGTSRNLFHQGFALQRQKEEIAAAKVRARRKAAIEKAEAALEDARRRHHEKAASIERDREMLERRAQDEENGGRNWRADLRRVCGRPAASVERAGAAS